MKAQVNTALYRFRKTLFASNGLCGRQRPTIRRVYSAELLYCGAWALKVQGRNQLDSFYRHQLIRSLHPVFHAYGKKGSPCKVSDITSPKTHHSSLVALVRRHYATTGPNLNPNLVDPTFPPTSKRCYKRRSIVRYTQIYAISNTLFKITANGKR